MNKLFNGAEYIINVLSENGYQGYIVGGYVRDLILKRACGDIDITTNALPQDIKRLFKITIDTGIKHGTVTVVIDKINYEVTTFRKEAEYLDYRRPSRVIFVNDLESDLSRRDFTINAMALDLNGLVIDPFNGREDLKREIIKTVGIADERFKEDALRMLRAIRFSSQLNFDIENETLDAISKNAYILSDLPIERIMSELSKLITGENVIKAFDYLQETKLDNNIYGISEGVNYCVKHNLKNISLEQFLAICIIYNREIIIKKWKLSNKSNILIKNIVLLSNKDTDLCDPILIFKYGKDATLLANEIKMSLYNDEDKSIMITSISKTLTVSNLSDLAIKGDDLKNMFPNRKPGSWIREILDDILYEVLKGNINNKFKEIKDFVLKNY